MKKLKILPSMLMLVLCVGVLAIGVFAITPTKNQITGSITINAINAGMEITPFKLTLDKDGNETARQALVQEPIISRQGIDIPLGNLSFNTENANIASDVADIVIAFSVKNTSSEALGMYFSTVATPTPTATTESIKLSAVTSGETPTTIPEMVEASFSGYNYLPIGSTGEIKLTFSLLKTYTEPSSITLDTSNISLNITNLNSELLVDGWETPESMNEKNYGIGEMAAVKRLRIPEETTSYELMGYMESLETIILPDSLTSFEFDASYHPNLNYNIDPNNPEMKFLGSSSNPYFLLAFSDTVNRTDVVLPDGLKIISTNRFLSTTVTHLTFYGPVKYVVGTLLTQTARREFIVTLKSGEDYSDFKFNFITEGPAIDGLMAIFSHDVDAPSTASPYYLGTPSNYIVGTIDVDTTYYLKFIEG